MNFTQKVYYNDKPIILTNDADAYKSAHPAAANYKVFNELTALNFSDALLLLEGRDAGLLMKESSPVALVKHLGKLFKIIQAGGGLVVNPQEELLMIFRRGKWDLPKGKLDKGETIDECALREVREETGIVQLELGEKISETWHLYTEKSKNLVKHTTWFMMSTTASDKLLPQAEEDILEARWVKPNALGPLVSNTYRAIKDVLLQAGYKW